MVELFLYIDGIKDNDIAHETKTKEIIKRIVMGLKAIFVQIFIRGKDGNSKSDERAV